MRDEFRQRIMNQKKKQKEKSSRRSATCTYFRSPRLLKELLDLLNAHSCVDFKGIGWGGEW